MTFLQSPSSWLAAAIVALVIALIGGGPSSAATSPLIPQVQEVQRPNIILINLDDADMALMSGARLDAYPTIKKLSERSIRFTNCHVTTPLCGPSRSCLLRSQYAHNLGFRTNRPGLDVGGGFTGGTQFYHDQGYDQDDLPVWLKRAGYHTMLVGKYYQGKTERVPIPGWDNFRGWLGNQYFDARRVAIAADGKFSGGNMEGYRTTNETNDAVELIKNFKESGKDAPFFLYLAPMAPHSGPTGKNAIPEKWKNRWVDVKAPRGESFDEESIDDKPAVYRNTPRFGNRIEEFLDHSYRVRLIAMLGVNDMVTRVKVTLDRLQIADETIIVLTSDHGYMLGEHRQFGKSFPTDTSTRVPLWVYRPWDTESRDATHLLAHIDISATIADLAGAEIPNFVDGRSFKQLIEDPTQQDRTAIRESVLIENWESRLNSADSAPVVYSSMRTNDAIYTQWSNGEHESYDLVADPHQLANTYSSKSIPEKESLAAQLKSLKQKSSSASTIGKLTISRPYFNRRLIGASSELLGFADSSSGVSDVKVTIKQANTGKFWTGTEWSSDEFAMAPIVASPGSVMTQWNLVPNLAYISAGEEIQITVTGQDQQGRPCEAQTIKAIVDAAKPEIVVVRPRDGIEYDEFYNFGGTMADDQAVGTLKLSIKDTVTGKYFDKNGEWQTQSVLLPTMLNVQNKNWHMPYEMPSGSYELRVSGTDAAGNVAELEPIKFSVK